MSRAPRRVAVLVFAEVDAVDDRDAERVLANIVRRELTGSTVGDLPTTLRLMRPADSVTWTATVAAVEGMSSSSGMGYTRTSVTDRAFTEAGLPATSP